MRALEDLDEAAVGRPATAAAIDLETIELAVWGAACTIFAPASWCWPSPAMAIERVSPLACSPMR